MQDLRIGLHGQRSRGDTNPQELLQRLFLGKDISADEPLVRYCTGCYRCTGACPWKIRIPEVIRALRHELDMESPFEKAFKGSVAHLGQGIRAVCAPYGGAVPPERRIYEAYDEVDGIHGVSPAAQGKEEIRWNTVIIPVVRSPVLPISSIRACGKFLPEAGHTLKEIPDWNCCGALEYGDRKELTNFSKKNLEKAGGISKRSSRHARHATKT